MFKRRFRVGFVQREPSGGRGLVAGRAPGAHRGGPHHVGQHRVRGREVGRVGKRGGEARPPPARWARPASPRTGPRLAEFGARRSPRGKRSNSFGPPLRRALRRACGDVCVGGGQHRGPGQAGGAPGRSDGPAPARAGASRARAKPRRLHAAVVVACTRWLRKSGRRGGSSSSSSSLRCRGRRLRETARYCGRRAGCESLSVSLSLCLSVSLCLSLSLSHVVMRRITTMPANRARPGPGAAPGGTPESDANLMLRGLRPFGRLGSPGDVDYYYYYYYYYYYFYCCCSLMFFFLVKTFRGWDAMVTGRLGY